MVENRSRIIGSLLLLIGFVVLLDYFMAADIFDWPFFVIIPGLALFALSLWGGKNLAGLAVPGSIVTATGLILLVQNVTDSFESWAYAWALLLSAVGFGIFIKAMRGTNDNDQRSGTRLMMLGLILFAIFGIFFEFFIFKVWMGQFVWRYVFPGLLLGAGGYLLWRGRRRA